jgi:hypothetical protein
MAYSINNFIGIYSVIDNTSKIQIIEANSKFVTIIGAQPKKTQFTGLY